MKKELLVLILSIFLFSAGGQIGFAAAPDDVVSVKLKGLVCDFCATAVQKTFRKRAEVADANVDLTTKLLTISLKDGRALDDETIKKLVANAGYTIAEITR